MVNACDSPYDLPLYPRLNLASCHDSVSFVNSWAEFSQRFNLGAVDKMLLDAAHDAEAIYQLIDHKNVRSEEHTSELQSRGHLVCRLLLEKKKNVKYNID